MVKKIPVDEQAQLILSSMTFRKLPDGTFLGKIVSQLERKVYEKVNKALEVLGGKWNRKAGGHLFSTDPLERLQKAVDEENIEVEKDGFFKTPPDIVARMVAICGDLNGLNILEPSAGSGAIAAAITEAASVFCIEKNVERATILRRKGYAVHNFDFLESGPFTPGFDRIIMNPPFENGQDIDHIQHAFTMLAPDGFLISVMCEGPFFRSDKKAIRFREWLEEVNGNSIILPEKSFHISGTDVNTRLVFIRAAKATQKLKGGNIMKTILQAQDLGTFSVEDESKLTFRQMLKEVDLNPKEWKLVDTSETKTRITYVIERKLQDVASAATPEMETKIGLTVPVEEHKIETPYIIEEPLTGTILSGAGDNSQTGNKTLLTADISFPRSELETTLTVASSFAEKSYIPILTFVHLKAVSGLCTVKATNLEQHYIATVPVDGADFETCIPTSLVLQEIKALPPEIDKVMFSFADGRFTINNRCKLYTADPEEFPEIPYFNGDTLSFPGLREALKKVFSAISEDSTRYVLNGACVDFKNGKVVGTDGFRLHFCDISRPIDIPSVIIPKKAVKIILKHGSTDDMTVYKKDEKTYISVPIEGGVLITKTLEGNFPNYQDVMPQSNSVGISFSMKEFFQTMKGVNPISKNSIRLSVNGDLTIETEDQGNTYQWHIPCTASGKATADTLVFDFNPKFLVDAITAFGVDTVHIEAPESNYGAVLINASSLQGAVVMPVRR